VFGAVIARGQDHRQVFRHFRPGFDLDAERQKRLDAGLGEYLNADDLYPDARPWLQQLKDAGYFVGIAGNQPARAGHFLRELNLPADMIATSDDWGVAKPSPDFFKKLIEISGHQPRQIAYVGDRRDNDVLPARSVGISPIWIVRGPWAYIERSDPSMDSADRVAGLDSLVDLLAERNNLTYRPTHSRSGPRTSS
jgi:HAD superfamily hydrolase (TIGR01549 family)